MISDELREGQILAGKYRIERLLGSGGMGVVLSAVHIELDQRVAIKVLKRDLAESESISERFRREARAACRIRSPHGARVIDVGTTEDALPYMVMEYLDGHDLSAELEKRGSLPVEEAATYVIQAADAICDAHDENIIHRDIKPANLFLTERAGLHAVKVLDFGISKSLQDTASDHPGLTQTQALIGSPMYMSPEQLDSPRTVDARTDIWSLGIVLYELVTGRPPFIADGIAGLIKQIVADEPPSLANFGVDAPPEFEAIIHRCLAKKRDDRFASVRELMLALTPFAKDSPMSVPMATRAAFGGRPSAARTAADTGSGGSAPGASDASLLPRPTTTQRNFGTRVATGKGEPSSPGASGTMMANAIADRAITPFGQSHTHTEAPKKSPLPWVIAGVAVAGAALVFVFMSKSDVKTDGEPPLAATAAATSVLPAALADETTRSTGQYRGAGQDREGSSEGSSSAAAVSNPSPSSSATAPQVNIEPPPNVTTAPVPPPPRPGKRPPRPPAETTPSPKPPSGISDFGGRH